MIQAGMMPSGFGFDVQLSITEKGQYALAYDPSCKKDCHELHTKVHSESSDNTSLNQPISETSVIGRDAGFKMR